MSLKTLSIIPDLSDSFFSDRFNKIDRLFSKLTGNRPINKLPKYNIEKKNNNFYLTISLPGWKENEIEINYTNKNLNIIGKKEEKKNKNNKNWIYKNIIKNNFNINYNIPENIEIKKANLKYGLLKIKMQQIINEKEKPKKININTK